MKIIKTANYKKLARTTPIERQYMMDQEVENLAREALTLMGGGRGFEAEVAINEVVAKKYRGRQIPPNVESLKSLIRQKLQELPSGMPAI